MAGIREKKKEQTLRAILDAAKVLFVEKGFDGTSMEALAKKAGIGKSTIYGYFRTKEEILLAFCEEEIDYAFARFAETQDLQAPLEEQLTDFYMHQFRFITRDREFGRVLMKELTFPKDATAGRCKELEDRYIQAMNAILAPARQLGALHVSEDPLTDIGHFYALYLIVLSGFYSGYILDETEAENSLRQLFQKAIYGMAPRNTL